MIAELLRRTTFPPPGTPVVCGFSGGADSTALVVLALAAGCDVTAVHVHHGLRPSADHDEVCARRTAERLGVPFHTRHIELADGPNLEARARDGRRSVLGSDALTGHTADDQAETLLLALMRGSGAQGLGAMEPGPTHPILRLRRSETEALCRSEDLDVATDPTNLDARHRRNRVRNELLALFGDIADRDPVPVLTRTADLLRDDDVLLRELAGRIDPTDARALTGAPPPLARRAIRRWLDREGYPPDAATIARVLDVASGTSVACDAGGGRRVERHQQRLSLVKKPDSGS